MTATLPDTIRTQAFIDGGFVDAVDGATFDSARPGHRRGDRQVAACGEADVDRAVAAARAAFDGGDWSRIAPGRPQGASCTGSPSSSRPTADELALTEAIDAGKPITDCRDFDIPDVAEDHPLVRRGGRQGVRQDRADRQPTTSG